MTTLSIAALLTILDSLAAGAARLDEAIGIDASTAGSVAQGAGCNVATLRQALAIDDADVAELLSVFRDRQTLVVSSALYRALQGERLQVALDAHFGGSGSLNRALTNADVRVHPDLRKLGIHIDGINAFPPAGLVLGVFTVSGAGAGALTAITDIDIAAYGKGKTAVRADTVIGGSPIVATLTMKQLDGTTETRAVTLPAGSAIGTAVPIGTPSADRYIGVVDVALTGGTATDVFSIRTTTERSVAL